MLSAEIIAIGSELLTPRFQDSNSLYLTEQLNGIGIAVMMKSIVGDDENFLEDAVRHSLARTPVLITIGGLGPTEDDITRKIVARVLQRQLVLNGEILAKLQRRFKARGVEMPANNARQALVLTGSDILENNHGTAPGLWITAEKNHVILLPGPPSELKPMFEASCMPRLRDLAGGIALVQCMFRTAGLPESMLDARIAPIYTKYQNPETTILAKPGQVEVRLTARGKNREEAERLLKELADQIEHELNDFIFARSEQTLEEVVGMYLVMKGATISTAESCTGGMIAERLTDVPGSSRYFRSGLVCYSNESKMELAGIPPLLLEMQGAVSAEVARGLAEAIRVRAGTTIGVAVTGIAGPTGGSTEKPVGTVHIAVATPTGTEHRQFLFPGDRDKIRWQASQAALDMVRRELMKI
ncbi:MAG: competence/damage-inducible protein A [Acidobacteria bacterium]|nr:MAG: competence/damage-inducible protein A [Acidobacteriota bacterium]